MIVVLERDYANIGDRNAVFVTLRGQILGYVPRDYAQLTAPELDSAWLGKGVVTEKTPDAVPGISVRIDR